MGESMGNFHRPDLEVVPVYNMHQRICELELENAELREKLMEADLELAQARLAIGAVDSYLGKEFAHE